MKQLALQSFRCVDEPKSMDAVEVHPIMDICKRHELFEGHSVTRLAVMLAKTRAIKMRIDDVLFNVGDQGASLFILLSGEVACIRRDGTEVKVLGAGTKSLIIGVTMKPTFCGRCDLRRACRAQDQQGAECHNSGQNRRSGVRARG